MYVFLITLNKISSIKLQFHTKIHSHPPNQFLTRVQTQLTFLTASDML